mgnify:CR=1 FL=1
MSGPRIVTAPRGAELSCKGWEQEAALRMLMNNLDPDVADALYTLARAYHALEDYERAAEMRDALRNLTTEG